MEQQIPNENFSSPPAKRRRGRPSGSKNKPKPPSSFRPHVLTISDGGDVAEAVTNSSRRLGGHVSILAANGPVSSAVLRNAPFSSADDITLRGCYEIVSMSTSGGDRCEIAVSMGGMNGELVGGVLSGPLVAAANVVVVIVELLDVNYVDECSGQEEVEMAMSSDEGANFVESGGGGGDDEWCRNWFGQCETDVRRCFDLLTAGGESGSGFGGELYDGFHAF